MPDADKCQPPEISHTFPTVLPHEGGPDYPPDGADRQQFPRIPHLTVLPHVGGPAYPPDGADRQQFPRIPQARTVLPHVGGPAYPPDGADRLQVPTDPGPDSLTSCRRGGLGEPKTVRLILPRSVCTPSPPSLPSSRMPRGAPRLLHPGAADHQHLLVPPEEALLRTSGRRCP